MVTTKQKPIVATQKMVKVQSKNNTKERHQITMEEGKKRKKKQRAITKAAKNTEQNSRKYIPIHNYFKYKWDKYSNQKTQSGWMD